MRTRLFPSLLVYLLRACATAAILMSVAHAEEASPSKPNLFNSLGKLLAPAPTPAAPTAGNRTLTVKPVGQGRRIALVIGNGNYRHPDNLPILANPAHDAEDIASALRSFGFEVIEKRNQTLEEMGDAIAEFGSRIGGSEAALFYFAGHGIQVNNQNYLMPVNARIASEAAVPYQGINVNQILDEMDKGKSNANIVMLDACRNNPISGKFRSGKSRGLASPGSTPKGTVIVYATDPGNTAADGEGRNGLFTAGLLTAFRGENLSLDEVLTIASAEVERASGRTQTPYVNGPKTLQREFHFRLRDGTQVAQLGPGISIGSRSAAQIEDELWDAIKHSDKERVFEEYMKQYPNGRYLAQARVKLAGLKAEATEAPKPMQRLQAPSVSARSDDPETQFWNEVKTSGSQQYLEAYLRQYPKGKYAALAKIELAQLIERNKAEAQRTEQAAWDEAKSGHSPVAYTHYLERYPNGRFASLAKIAKEKSRVEIEERERNTAIRLLREKDEAANEESRQWKRVMAASSEVAVRSFLDKHFNQIDKLKALAIKGDADAQGDLARLYVNGWGVPKDFQEGLAWARKAAGQGNSDGEIVLGVCFLNGYGVTKDEAEAVKWVRKSADNGNRRAQRILGGMFAGGQAVVKDDAEAVRWYRKSADQGDAVAQFYLGYMYDSGRGVAKDDLEAVRWYRKAADQGEPGAQLYLGINYDNGDGVTKDKGEAVRWYRKAADQGNAAAQFNLGVKYDNGEGVAKDDVEAVRWYRKAADQGNAGAQFNLGVMYGNGRGVANDDVEAVRWYRKAADQGYASAQFNLGVMYDNGGGVAKDKVEAVRWYRKAADQGHVSAQHNLGVMYAYGQGVNTDDAEAVRWFRKAAGQGFAKSQEQLRKRGLQ